MPMKGTLKCPELKDGKAEERRVATDGLMTITQDKLEAPAPSMLPETFVLEKFSCQAFSFQKEDTNSL